MKLLLPEVMHHLEEKPLVISFADGPTDIVNKNDAGRKRLVAKLLPMMHRAEKFVFDSGNDQDERTTNAFRETAVAMIEAKLFRLPYPLCWIEDPYTQDEEGNPVEPGTMSNFYLCEEKGDEIEVWFIQKFDLVKMPGIGRTGGLAYMIHPNPMSIDLTDPSDNVTVRGVAGASETHMKILGECAYAVKKFVVMLGAEQVDAERVMPPGGERTGGVKRTRRYAHTVVRIPFSKVGEGDGDGEGGPQSKRRLHLVRGFQWGKNTRPVEEQRWVKPYWRGDASVGVAERGHYRVG